MAEEEGNKEEKFDFTREGEALGYISSDQARVLAMSTARDAPGDYSPMFQGTSMAFEVVEAEDTKDHYVITITFRPQGEFAGKPGREQFFITKKGVVALRQVLALPKLRRAIPVVPAAIGLAAVVVVAAGAVFAAGGFGGNGPPPTATPLPTTTTIPPTPAPTGVPDSTPAIPAAAVPTPAPTATTAPTATAVPAPTTATAATAAPVTTRPPVPSAAVPTGTVVPASSDWGNELFPTTTSVVRAASTRGWSMTSSSRAKAARR